MTISASKLWLIHGFNQNTSVWWRKTFAAGASAGNTGVPGIRSGLNKKQKRRTRCENRRRRRRRFLCCCVGLTETFEHPTVLLKGVGATDIQTVSFTSQGMNKGLWVCQHLWPRSRRAVSAAALFPLCHLRSAVGLWGKIFFNDKGSLNLYSHRRHSPETLKTNLWLVNEAVRHRIIFNRGAMISQISFVGLIHQIKSCLICGSESERV